MKMAIRFRNRHANGQGNKPGIVRTALFIQMVLAAWISITPAYAVPISVDQILYKLNPVGGLTLDQARNLSGTVEMTYVGSVLTVTLANTSGITTADASASNLLTGLGFMLPDGVSVAAGSSIALSQGASVLGGGVFTQNVWGWGSGTPGGHFSNLGVLPVNLTLSSLAADANTTFEGNPSNQLDGTNYGLQSATGSQGIQERILAGIVFSLNLQGVTGDLLSFIEGHGVVLTYGSPADLQGQTNLVPEPATMLLLGSGLAGLAGFGRRFRKS